MIYNNFKVCNNCRELKEVSEFYLNHRTKKPRGFCKDCEKIRVKKYRIKNSEKIYNYNKEYREKNKQRVQEYYKTYYINNREKLKMYQKEYYINKSIREVKNNLYK